MLEDLIKGVFKIHPGIPHIPPVNVIELLVCKEYEHGMYKHIPPVNVIELLVCKEYEHGMFEH